MIITLAESRLSERQAEIVDLAARNRLLTLAMLQLRYPADTPDALRMQLGRLVATGWLVKFPLGNREHYYCLGPVARRHLLSEREHRPFRGFGHAGVVQYFAIAMLCVRHGLTRLTKDEFVKALPGHHKPGMPSKNYLIRTDGTDETLYMAIVDHATSPERLAHKVGEIFAKRDHLPEFRIRIRAGLFAVAVITGSARKAKHIEEALNSEQFRNAGTMVIPELEPLLAMDRRRR